MGYDAFISYSHAADGLLAPRLQDGLQRFAKPWWRRRALHVFRDETGLSVNPGLWTSITAAMDSSSYFVLLASPEAAESEWVNREIEHWKQTQDPARILPVVTDGEWVWNDATHDFAPGCTAVPAALAGVFVEEPRHLDLRWARDENQLDLQHPQFRDQIADLAATIHGVPKDDLAGADVREHRRTVRTAWAAVVALVMLAVLSGSAALAAAHNADKARRNEEAAVSAQQQADANAAQATTNAAQATTNAEDARRRKSEADANAARADLNSAAAEQQRQQATAAQAEAESNAQTAQIAQTDAERSAVNAFMSAQAAQQAQAATEVANQQLATTNDQLATTNDQLASTNDQLASTNDQLASTNQQLDQSTQDLKAANGSLKDALVAQATANSNLDSARLVALADGERTKGNYDTALLLANEAIDVAKTDAGPARNELLAIQNTAPLLERFLPGSIVPGSTPLNAGPMKFQGNRVATATPDGATMWVWQLDRPERGPVLLRSAGAPTGFSDDGSLLVTQPSGRLDIWATDSGTLVWSASSDYGAQLSPDRTAVAYHDGDSVALLDLHRLEVVARWRGQLATNFGECSGDRLGSDARQCEFSDDGNLLLGWSDADAAFVLWDRTHPRQTTLLYTPVGFDPSGQLAPIPRFVHSGGVVVGEVEPGKLAVFAADGTPTPMPGSPAAFAPTPDGKRVAEIDATGAVTLVDLNTATAMPLAHIAADCPDPFESIGVTPRGEWVEASTGCAAAFAATDGSAVREVELPFGVLAFGADFAGHERYALVGSTVVDLRGPNLVPIPGANVCFGAPGGGRGICNDEVIELDRFNPSARRATLGDSSFVRGFDDTGARVLGEAQSGRLWIANLNRTGPGEQQFSTPGDLATAYNLSPDLRTLVEAAAKGATILSIDTHTSRQLLVPADASIRSTRFAAPGARLVVDVATSAGEVTEVIDPNSGAVIGTVAGAVSLDEMGESLVALDPDHPGDAVVLSAIDLRRVRSLPATNLPRLGVGSPLSRDGSRLAWASDSTIYLVDTVTGAIAGDIPTEDVLGIDGLTFSPDGSRLAFQDFAGGATFVDVPSLRVVATDPAAQVDFGACGGQGGIHFSEDGTLLAVGSRLFNAANLAQIGPPLPCLPVGFTMADRFAANGASFAYVVLDRTGTRADVHVLPLGAAELRADACTIVGGNLTEADWNRFQPGDTYSATCPDWPSG